MKNCEKEKKEREARERRASQSSADSSSGKAESRSSVEDNDTTHSSEILAH